MEPLCDSTRPTPIYLRLSQSLRLPSVLPLRWEAWQGELLAEDQAKYFYHFPYGILNHLRQICSAFQKWLGEGFTGSLDNHMLPVKCLTALSQLPITVKPHGIPTSRPIPKTRWPLLMLIKLDLEFLSKDQEEDTTYIFPNPGSVQLGELLDS